MNLTVETKLNREIGSEKRKTCCSVASVMAVVAIEAVSVPRTKSLVQTARQAGTVGVNKPIYHHLFRAM